jgi:hypothetical protein
VSEPTFAVKEKKEKAPAPAVAGLQSAQPAAEYGAGEGLPLFLLNELRAGGRVQAKLSVSQPGDAQEQEADRVAEQAVAEPPEATLNQQKIDRVQIHVGPEAAAVAQSLHAQAFTIGQNIYFGSGSWAPQTLQGRWLLAHELAHVDQQETHADEIHRKEEPPSAVLVTVDPETMWNYLGRKSMDMLSMQESLDRANPGTPEERAAYRGQLEQIVRLNALGLLASHRAGVLSKRDSLGRPTSSTATSQSMQDLRDAAMTIYELNQVDERLRNDRYQMQRLQTRAIQRNSGDLEDAFNDLYEYSHEFMTEDLRAGIRGSFMAAQELGKGWAYWNFIWGASRALERELSQQRVGVMAATGKVYETYPMFLELSAERVVGNGYRTDDMLWFAASRAFGKAVLNIEDAIRSIATGSIHPYDLPRACQVTRENLPEPLKPALDEAIRSRANTLFWRNLGLTAAEIMVAFIPVVGPALALTLGTIQMGLQLEDILDRSMLADLSAIPSENPLGVQGVSTFEWVMFGVTAVLSAVGAAQVARQLSRAGRLGKLAKSGEAVEEAVEGVPRKGPGRAAGGEEVPETQFRQRSPEISAEGNAPPKGPPKGEEVFDELTRELGLSGKGEKAAKAGMTAERRAQLIQEARNIDTAESISGNYRLNFAQRYPEFPGGRQWQVHHSIPQKFRQTLRDAGIRVDSPEFLRGVRTTPGETSNVHARITNHWEDWHREFRTRFGREPGAAEVIEKAHDVDWRFSQLYWETEFEAGIPVPTRARLPGAQAAATETAAPPTAGVERNRLLAPRNPPSADPAMPPGAGKTDKFGNITYSSAGSATDQSLALAHERVHSFLSPRLNALRELRADVGIWGYKRSALLKYLEEALAETYAQVSVRGVRHLPQGIRFPIQQGYVTLSAVVTEAAIGTVVYGGVVYGVYVWTSI